MEKAITFGTHGKQIGEDAYCIDDPRLPYATVREYDDAGYRRGSMFWWGIYHEGVAMPATKQGWCKSPGHAQRAIERNLEKDRSIWQ